MIIFEVRRSFDYGQDGIKYPYEIFVSNGISPVFDKSITCRASLYAINDIRKYLDEFVESEVIEAMRGSNLSTECKIIYPLNKEESNEGRSKICPICGKQEDCYEMDNWGICSKCFEPLRQRQKEMVERTTKMRLKRIKDET